MPKISVIVPVYNTENYVKKSLDSLCNSIFNDIEIICINDGSKDNSWKILKKYAATDKRIKIINLKDNRGTSFARNRGIKEACGDYLAFVDSDDYVEDDFFL